MASVSLQDAIDATWLLGRGDRVRVAHDAIAATVAATHVKHGKEKDAAHNLADAAERLAEVARRVPAAADLADPAVGLAVGV